MTSIFDPNAQSNFDAAKESYRNGELADTNDIQSASANSLREPQAVRQKSDDRKAQDQELNKVIGGAIEAENAVFSSSAKAGVIVENSKSKKDKEHSHFVQAMMSLQNRIDNLDQAYSAFQDIFDNYTDDEIRAGKHLNENGKFNDPKAEEYWQQYCILNGLDPNDPELRKDPAMLQSVQNWVLEEWKQSIEERDLKSDSTVEANQSDIQTKQDAEKNSEAVYDIAETENETQGLTTEEQEFEDFKMIRSDGVKYGDSEDEIREAEKAQLGSMSEGAIDYLKNLPDKQYLFEGNDKTEPQAIIAQPFTP